MIKIFTDKINQFNCLTNETKTYRSLPFVHELSFILLKKTSVFGWWHDAQLC